MEQSLYCAENHTAKQTTNQKNRPFDYSKANNKPKEPSLWFLGVPLAGYAPHHQITFGDGVLWASEGETWSAVWRKQSKKKSLGRLVAIPNQSQLLHTNNNPKPRAWRGLGLK